MKKGNEDIFLSLNIMQILTICKLNLISLQISLSLIDNTYNYNEKYIFFHGGVLFSK